MTFRDDKGSSSGAGLIDSAKDATSGRTFAIRVVAFLVFGIVLGIQYMIANLDAVGRTGQAWYYIFPAIFASTKAGLAVALASIYPVILDLFGPRTYFSTHSYGSIGFTIFMFLLLTGFIYQPISWILNVIDFHRGQVFGFFVRLLVTLVVIFILSMFVYYARPELAITTAGSAVPVAEAVTQNVAQVVNETVSSGGTVISLL